MTRKAKTSEIKVWYRFRPSIDCWFSRMKGKSHYFLLPDETWYDGYPFYAGWFAFIQFKYFSFHFIVKWWRIKL